MANVLLTGVCNRSCPYCFASGKTDLRSLTAGQGVETRAAAGAAHMSLEDLEHVIGFFHRSEMKVVALLGGEPTLHPQFEEVVRRLHAEGFAIKLFTNGLMSRNRARFLAEAPGQRNVIVNVNDPRETPAEQWRHASEVLGTLGTRASLSFNVYRPDADFGFLLELIRERQLERVIRVGLAMPVYGTPNQHLPMSDYAHVGARLADFGDVCAREDVSLRLDCGFPVCMFTPEQIGRIVHGGGEVNFQCRPIIDIGPDLRVWSCFALSGLFNVHLRDFRSRQDLIAHFDRHFEPYRHVGALPQCVGCPHIRRQQCFGGCVAHTLTSFHGGGPVVAPPAVGSA
jgi:MoaA/NifB/PqqE/SkfB family radical SAM enzyme